MKKNSKKQTGSTKQYDSPGRPKYTPKFPKRAEFTFIQFMEINGVETNPASKNYGKGPNCTMLTLRKFLTRDAKKLGRSQLFRVRGVTAEPNSKDGLGRRGYLYSVRAGAKAVKVAKAPRKVKTAPVAKAPKAPAGLSDATKTYEDIKNILAQPSPAIAPEVPAVAVTVPVVTIAPEPAPAPAPAVEAPATSTLPVANLEPVTQ